MHQCNEKDEDFADDIFNLYQAWDLKKLTQSANESMTESTTKTKFYIKRVFVPINDQFSRSREAFTRPGGGSHWSLLLWTITSSVPLIETSQSNLDETVPTSFFYHFDSSSGYNSLAAAAVAQKLLKVLHCNLISNEGSIEVDANVMECKTPQQNNAYDCGLYLLGFTEALSLLCVDSTMSQFIQEKYEVTLHEYASALSNGKCEVFTLLRKRIVDDIRDLISRGF